MSVRSKVAMVMAEFIGTAILATSVINVARSQIGIGYFVAFSAAITFAVLTMIFRTSTNAHFNPAVTFSMWTARQIKTLDAVASIAAQMLGGFAAWRLAQYFTGQPLANIAGKTFSWKVAIAELVGTFVFTFGLAAATYQRQENGRFAATAGASLFAGVVIASLASNAILNPAIALGNQSWGRAYIFAPLVGALVGVNLYKYLYAPTRSTVSSTTATKTVVDTAAVAPSRKVASRKPVAKKKSSSRRTTK